MKILHLEAGRHFYGGSRQLDYLVRGLALRGVDNLIVCQAGNPLAATASSADVRQWAINGDLDLTLSRRLRQLIAQQHPDLVHVHSRRGADTFGGRAARAAGVPALLTRRVQSAEPGLWLRFKCKPYAAIVAISTAVRTELVAAGIEPERLRLIPSVVDTSLFRPDGAARERLIARYGLPADARIAGMAAQFISRKGHALLLPLVRAVNAAMPGLRLLLFGQGPTRARFERRVRAAGLDRVVRLCGHEPDWPRLLPGLDLLVHPVRREGLGAVVLEAMSAGVPVVASAVGGIVDAIESGTDGLLLPPEDIDAWSQAVLGLLNDADERARLALAALRKVEAHFTIGQMSESYLELYRAVLEHGV